MVAPEIEPEKSSRFCVLVVDDEVLIRMDTAEALRNIGLQVVEEGSADEALAYLLAGGVVDLVFSDVRMPGSMNGLELAEALRRDFPDIKVVLTSGHLSAQGATVADTFFAKPYDLEVVVAGLLELLEGGR